MKTFIDIANEIGDFICKTAFWSDYKCNWLGRTLDNFEEYATYDKEYALPIANKPLGPEVYNGTSGISLFLAQLYSVSKDEEYRKTAEGSIRHALYKVKDIDARFRYGLYSGVIGIAFAAVKLGILFDNEAIIEDANKILKNLSSTGTNKIEHFKDMMSGNAGAIVSLIEIYDTLRENYLIDLAVDLGNELVYSSIKEPTGWSWDFKANGVTASQHNLTGYSHGTAGIGFSLLKLYSKTNNEKFHIAGEKAFEYENSCYSERYNNWLDFRTRSRQTRTEQDPDYACMTAWCHGAPGILNSHLFAYDLLHEDKFLTNCKPALCTVMDLVRQNVSKMQANFESVDFSLCHGLSGVCESLLYASRILKEDLYKEVAVNAAIEGIVRYGHAETAWPCGIKTGCTPSLMLGLAGIGYFYLRLSKKAQIPTILTVGNEFCP